MRSRSLGIAAVLAGAAALVFAGPIALAGPMEILPANGAAEVAVRPLQIVGTVQTIYDDNLYRLPSSLSPQDVGLGGNISRSDRIDTASAGVNLQWLPGAQAVTVSSGAAYNHFARNTALNNASGFAKIDWDWRLADRWSGKLSSHYEQTLANFANSHFFAKDVLHTYGYAGEIDWQIGSHLFLDANAQHSTTTHGADARQYENYVADTGGFGVGYLTEVGNQFGWDYAYTHGNYPRGTDLVGTQFGRRYDQSTSKFNLKYALTGKTTLQGDAGYLKRSYPNFNTGAFSGTIWNAILTWNPGAKTQVAVNTGRQLTAYLDSQSDYFVSNATGVSLAWSPTLKLSFGLKYSHDRDRFIGTALGVAVSDTRHETVDTGRFTSTWSPTDNLSLTLGWGLERRKSTVSFLTYNDNSATLGVGVSF